MNKSVDVAALLLSAVVGGAAASAPARADGDMQPFVASYTLNYKGLNAAVTTLTLSRIDGDRWRYRSSGEARGIFRALPIDNPAQSSELRITADAVQPLHFTQSNGNDDSHAIELRFEWPAARVRGTVERRAVDESVPPDTQDDMSVQIALIHAMARGDDGGTFHTYGDRGPREYRWRTEGGGMLRTAIGDVATRIFVTERSGSPRVTRYWCSPEHGFLPLKVEQKRLDSVEWTLEIRSLKRG
jgi:hypothetical protein